MHHVSPARQVLPPLPKGAKLSLGILFAVFTCNMVDRYIMSLLIEPLRNEFELSDMQLGLMTNLAYGVSYGLFVIPVGMLVDRFNRRNLLMVMLFLWSAFTAMCGFATSFVSLAALRASVGAAESAATPVSMSLIADTVPPERRSTAAGFLYAASPLGLFLSFAIGSYVVQEYGWRSALLIAGLPGLLLTIVVWLFLMEPQRGRYDAAPVQAKPAAASLGETLRFLFATPQLLAAIGSLLFLTVTAASMMAWITSFLIRNHGLELGDAGMIVAVVAAIGTGSGSVGNGWLADRMALRDLRWPLWLSAAGALLGMISGIGMVYAGSLFTAIIAMFLFKVFSATHLGPTLALTMSAPPARMRGTIVAVQQVAINLVGFGVGPVLTGVVSDAIGGPESLRPALALTLCINLLAACLLIYAARFVRGASS